ncbi:hypothetical protein TWF730_002140 [Orbilia blumenaviensis]|uniref:Uncharacterized protein n=1 Tax=Orbilia blumenaviensis TaxID=1796055 RepID=A0AAV9UHC0_9PEZI
MASLLRTIGPPRLQPRISALPRSPTLRKPIAPFPIVHMLKPTAPQRAFSSQRPMPNPNQGQEVSHEMPKVNWKDLGASRTVKIVVIVALSIVGTMETIFYFKLFMRRFFPDEEAPVTEDVPAVEDTKST